jgi:GST-like protein
MSPRANLNQKAILYGGTGCGSAAVEVMLTFAKLPYELVIATPWEPTPALEDLRRINPLGQVPTLVMADGTVMTESAAMMMALSEYVPEMIPADATARVALYRWLTFIPANIYAMFTLRDFPVRWVDDEAAQTQLKDRATERMKHCYAMMESAVSPSPYLLGVSMTALDVYLAMTTNWTPRRAWFNEHCPKIMRAMSLTEQHPVIAAVWKKNFS